MANEIKQQIQQQRKQISTQRQQFQTGKRKSLQRSQQELRGQQRGKRKPRKFDPLVERQKRKAEKGKFVTALEQLTGKEVKFETEVAEKAPEFGKEKYVAKEFKEAKSKLDKKINQLQTSIEREQERIKKYKKQKSNAQDGDERDDLDERIEDLQDNIHYLKTEQGVLKKYTKDRVKAIKGVNTGFAFKEASIKARNEEIEDRNSEARRKQMKELGFTSQRDFILAKPILKKLQKGTATIQEANKLPSQVRKSLGIQDDIDSIMVDNARQIRELEKAGIDVQFDKNMTIQSVDGMSVEEFNKKNAGTDIDRAIRDRISGKTQPNIIFSGDTNQTNSRAINQTTFDALKNQSTIGGRAGIYSNLFYSPSGNQTKDLQNQYTSLQQTYTGNPNLLDMTSSTGSQVVVDRTKEFSNIAPEIIRTEAFLSTQKNVDNFNLIKDAGSFVYDKSKPAFNLIGGLINQNLEKRYERTQRNLQLLSLAGEKVKPYVQPVVDFTADKIKRDTQKNIRNTQMVLGAGAVAGNFLFDVGKTTIERNIKQNVQDTQRNIQLLNFGWNKTKPVRDFALWNIRQDALRNQRNLRIAGGVAGAVGRFTSNVVQDKLRRDTQRNLRNIELVKQVGSDVAPYIKTAGQEVKDFAMFNIQRDIQERQRLLTAGQMIFQDVAPPIKEGASEVGRFALWNMQRDNARRQLFFNAGQDIINKSSPFFNAIGGIAEQNLRRDVQRNQRNLMIAGSLFGMVADRTPEAVKSYTQSQVTGQNPFNWNNLLLKPLVRIGTEGRKAREEGKESFNLYGTNIQTDKTQGEVYNWVSGVKQLSSKGWGDIFLKSGTAGAIATLEKNQQPEYISDMAFSDSLSQPLIKPSEEDIKTKSEELGKNLIGVADTSLYFTPVKVGQVGLGLAESQFSPFKLKDAPQNVIQFAKTNPSDTLYFALAGTLKAGQMGFRAWNKPITKTQLYKPRGSLRQPQAFISIPIRRTISGSRVTDIRRIKGISETIKVGRKTTYTTRFRELFGRKPLKVTYNYPKITKNIFSGKAIITSTDDFGKPIIKIIGTEKSKPIIKIVDGLKTRGGLGRIRFIKSGGSEIMTKGDKTYYKFFPEIKTSFLDKSGRAFSKTRQAGKYSQLFEVGSGVKEKGLKDVPINWFDDVVYSQKANVYQEGSIFRSIIPSKRAVDVGSSKVFVQEGSPAWTFIDDSVKQVKGFQGGGNPSSQ